MKTASDQSDFLKKIQDTSSTADKVFKYSLADLIAGSGDFFIGKEGGPNKVGGDYYLGAKASEADYIADTRNSRGYPTNPSPFRLRLKVAVLIDPSGPIQHDRPKYILVSRKKHKQGMRLVNSEIQFANRTTAPTVGPIPAPTGAYQGKFYYSDFPKGSVSYEQCVIKDTSADVTAQIDAWPEFRKRILAASYTEVREEARLSELDWEITGFYSHILCEGHEYKYGVHFWNCFIVVYGTITDHIRLYRNNAAHDLRTSTLNNPTLARQLSDRANKNIISGSYGKSYYERGTIQVVEIGVTDPKTWLGDRSHEKLIYDDLLNLA